MIECCPVCGSHATIVDATYRAVDPVFKGMERVHCAECDMVFAEPMPDRKSLESFNNSYFASAHGIQSDVQVSTAFFSAIAKLRVMYVENFLEHQNINVSSVLEVGPGLGYFARSWLEKYPDTNYMAIETDQSCYDSLQKSGVKIVTMNEVNDGQQKVDLVVMSHVLEHVSSPREFITAISSKLNVGGAIFIEVPCRDWEHKSLDEPHLLFFEKDTMGFLLNHTGFKNVETNYYGEEIKRLLHTSILTKLWRKLRTKLIDIGLVFPFSSKKKGMEQLANPLERAVISPYKAHCETSAPAWWLRAIAIKK